MKTELNNNVLTIYPEGRISSLNANEIGIEFDKVVSEYPGTDIVLDFDKIEYVSSAGLRILLKLKKASPALKIINVSNDVYEILDMTGFTEMIDVHKAYRRFSVEGCEVIGHGANGVVYRLDEETIIKVYRDPNCLPEIQRERELARKAFVLGIPTAIPYDVCKVNDTYGSVFELLNAKSFAQLAKCDKDNLDKYIDMYVDLGKKIHSTELKPGEIPDMRLEVISWVEFLKEHLPSKTYEKLYALVNDIPTDYHMLHSDFHLKNVMLQNGEILLIDMDTLSCGNKVYEFAFMFNAYQGYGEQDHSLTEEFLGISWEDATYVWNKSLKLYFSDKTEEEIKAIEDKARLVGTVRMLRRLIRRNCSKQEIEFKTQKIIELVDRIDCLAI